MRYAIRRFLLARLTAAAIVFPPAAAAQAGQAAVLTGRVADAAGTPVPAATVSAVSASLVGRLHSTATDDNGMYRFPSLPPGAYIVTAERDGFTTARHENVALRLGRRSVIDLMLLPGRMPDTVRISDTPPVIDIRASAAEKHLPREALEFLPFPSRFGPAAMLLAPGIHPSSYAAYGSGGSPANAYLIEGVDLSDPERGTIWVFTNHNWIEDARIIAFGADAEYGGFTGVASNTIFRSGSNVFHGLAETLYRPGWLTGSNVPDGIEQAHPRLADAAGGYVTDSTLQAGGAISQDRLWYFTGVQYHRGGSDARVTTAPRFLFKPTLRAGDRGRLTGFLEADRYTVDVRGNGLQAPAGRHDSPQMAWNTSYTHVLSPSSVFDLKYAGFTGHYRLTTAGDREIVDAHRSRNQVNAGVTRFAPALAGEHTLKAGAEVERSDLRHSRNMRVSAYAQDAWQLSPRLTLNPGIRVDHIRERLTALDDDVLRTTSWGPRIGFAYDLSGTARTVLNGHWGRYFDGAKSAHYDSQTAASRSGRQPRLDQATLGIQHELFSDLSVGATAIHRRYEDSIDGMDGSYRGLELMAAKPFSSRIMVQSSWVVGSTDAGPAGGTTHLLKVLGLWRGPLRIIASTAYVRASGQTLPGAGWQRLGERDGFFGELVGPERLDAESRLDVKLEKQLEMGYRRRLGLTLEGFNLFNNAAVTRVADGEILVPAAISHPRQLRLGAVLRF